MEQIKVYLDGTMVAFTTVDDVPLESYPRGWVVLQPLGTVGFTFTDADSNKVLYQIADFNNILDATGSPYGVTQLAVFSALNAFLGFNSGGGGGITGADNGNELIGTTVGWGGALNRPTSIGGNNQLLAIGYDGTFTPDPIQTLAVNAAQSVIFDATDTIRFTNTTGVVNTISETIKETAIISIDMEAPLIFADTDKLRVKTSGFIYFGSGLDEGDWRLGLSFPNFIYQRLESSVWVTKQTILA